MIRATSFGSSQAPSIRSARAFCDLQRPLVPGEQATRAGRSRRRQDRVAAREPLADQVGVPHEGAHGVEAHHWIGHPLVEALHQRRLGCHGQEPRVGDLIREVAVRVAEVGRVAAGVNDDLMQAPPLPDLHGGGSALQGPAGVEDQPQPVQVHRSSTFGPRSPPPKHRPPQFGDGRPAAPARAPRLPPTGFMPSLTPPPWLRPRTGTGGRAGRAGRTPGSPRSPARRALERPPPRRAGAGWTARLGGSGCGARRARPPRDRIRAGIAGGSRRLTASGPDPEPARQNSAARWPQPSATQGAPDHPARERAWPPAREASTQLATSIGASSVVSAWAE